MREFIKYTVALIAILAFCSPEAYAKRKIRQREEVINAEKGYGYELESSAASMVVQYKSVREEFIFEEGRTLPSMRIIRQFKLKGFEDVCYECGHVQSSSTFKGAMIAHNVSRSTDNTKEKINVNGWLD